jgi:hypothetical protein
LANQSDPESVPNRRLRGGRVPDASLWEEAKKKGDAEIKKMIDTSSQIRRHPTRCVPMSTRLRI